MAEVRENQSTIEVTTALRRLRHVIDSQYKIHKMNSYNFRAILLYNLILIPLRIIKLSLYDYLWKYYFSTVIYRLQNFV